MTSATRRSAIAAMAFALAASAAQAQSDYPNNTVRIVVDSAPTTVTDPAAVLTLADSVILVVREGTTTKPAIAHAVSSLGTTKLLGMVFNASTAPQQPHYATTV